MPLHIGLDRFQRKAELLPLVTALLPLAILVLIWVPNIRTLPGATIVGLGAAAVLALMMSWVGQRGYRVQQDLVALLGGLPTTILMRHRDTRLPAMTRQRVHKLIKLNGFHVPTEEDEAKDPAAADAGYDAGIAWLRQRTRKNRLLLDGLIEYAYRRNLLGLQRPALALLAFCFVANAALISVVSPAPIQRAVAGLCEGAYAAAALLWFEFIRMSFVEAAAWDYAERLMNIAAAEPMKAA